MADSSDQSELGAGQPDLSTRSNPSNYSEDTFESITNEESGSGGEYESEVFESYSDEESESLSPSVSQHEGLVRGDAKGERSQLVEAGSYEKERLGQWIAALQDKKTLHKPPKVGRPREGAPQQAPDDEVKALQSFCLDKLRQIQKSSKYQPQKVRNEKKQQAGAKATVAVTPDETTTAPMALYNRIYMDNMRETTKHIKGIQIHDPSKCPACSAKKAELAKIDFIRRKKTAMEELLLLEKIEEQLYLKDSVTLIGEIHRTLPRLSEDPQLIWQKLLKTGQT